MKGEARSGFYTLYRSATRSPDAALNIPDDLFLTSPAVACIKNASPRIIEVGRYRPIGICELAVAAVLAMMARGSAR